MDHIFRDVPPERQAEARKHFQGLIECGLSQETLFRLLVEFCQQKNTETHHSGHVKRASVSTTTSSEASGRESFLSRRSSVSSASSHDLPASRAIQSSRSSASTRAYWCTSCETKFQRKFDWKRHEEEFHERYKKFPCNQCNRVFWGSNTFNQHHKAAHGCQTCPHADAVVQYTKRKKAWACGFCATLLPSRDKYYECVASHYENGGTKAHWSHSKVIYGLLHQRPLHRAWKELWESKYGHLPKEQRPVLEWSADDTGRAQGFLENECPGNLQDLLEFFDEALADAASLVQMAYDLADKFERKDGITVDFQPALMARAQTVTVSRRVSESQASSKKQKTSAVLTRHFSAPHPRPQPSNGASLYSHSNTSSSHLTASQFPSSRLGQRVSAQMDGGVEKVEPLSLRLVPASGAPYMASSLFPTIAELPEAEASFLVPEVPPLPPVDNSNSDSNSAVAQTFADLDTAFADWNSLTTTVLDESFASADQIGGPTSSMIWEPDVHFFQAGPDATAGRGP